MNLAQLLEQSSERFGRRRALVFGRRKVSYRLLNEMANQLARALNKKLGSSAGRKAAILLNNSTEYIVSLFAVFKAGYTAIPVNIFLRTQEIRYIFMDSSIDLLITSADFLSIAGDAADGIITILTDERKEGCLFLDEVIKGQSRKNLTLDIKDNDLALVLYTSGTTGHPKGAMLTHKNIISNVEASRGVSGVNIKDRILLLLPMFHSFTITVCIFLPISTGARIIILNSIRPFNKVLRALIFRRVTLLIGIPGLFKIISEARLSWLFLRLISLRLCISGADALDKQIIRNFEKKFRFPLLEGYGLTEASPVVSLNPPDKAKPGSVGLPVPGVIVKVVAEDESELPSEEVGELIVKGPNVMKGYLNLPEETNKTIKGEWLFTGDLAKIDKDGYVYIVDRKKDMLIHHGMNIYPREIELVLLSHPRIKEAAVIGRKDPKRGELPAAFIVVNEGEKITPQEVVDFCRQRLANYKVPHIIEFRENLPKTPTGKVLKRAIK